MPAGKVYTVLCCTVLYTNPNLNPNNPNPYPNPNQSPHDAKVVQWKEGLLDANLSVHEWRKSEQWTCKLYIL
jgi:hypothetical protein